MITLPELLEDAKYKKYFCTAPKMLPTPGQKPWQIKLQLEKNGPWKKKEFETYVEAFGTLRKYLSRDRVYDGALRSRGIAFGPPERIVRLTKGGRPLLHTKNGKPVLDGQGNPIQQTRTVLWRPQLEATEEAHTWCPYCRRPTVFRWFKSHHALRSFGLQDIVDPTDRRCSICAVRESFVLSIAQITRPPHFDPTAHLTPKRRARR